MKKALFTMLTVAGGVALYAVVNKAAASTNIPYVSDAARSLRDAFDG